MLDLSEMPESGRTAKLEKDDYYFSPDGFLVFTEKYHLKRGYCCENGCKHCPYGFNPTNRTHDRPPKK